jgi:hypothetical protein
MTYLTQREVIRLLKKKAIALGSQKALADECGVSQAFLCDVLKTRRLPSEELAGAIGLRRINAVFVPR